MTIDYPITADSNGIILKIGDLPNQEIYWQQFELPSNNINTEIKEFLIDFTNKHTATLNPDSLSDLTLDKISKLCSELEILSKVKGQIETIIRSLVIQYNESKIQLSKTSESEFLIYLEEADSYKNILVDQDGDIEILLIPKGKRLSYNRTFYTEDGIDLSKIVSSFNEMR